MTENEIIEKLISTLDKAVEDFNSSIPGIQRDISYEVDRLVNELEKSGNTIKANVANLRKIAGFKYRIEKIIGKSDYPDKVDSFIDAFNEVATIQNQYFEKISSDFKPPKVLEEIKLQSISSTIESLTESGLNSNLIQPVHDILLKNATTGGKVSEMQSQLRDYINGSPDVDGKLVKYTKQITTDSLNQFSGQYMDTVTNDLNLEWHMYVGSLIKTSRPWCEACIAKKYIHRSEFQTVIDGDFPEFKDKGGVIYDKTGLPSGMIGGTNPSNLVVYRGGYNCGHSLVPVSDAAVPKYLRDKL